MRTIPIVDVSALTESNASAKASVAAALGAACREVGFFYVAGHGIPQAVVADVFAAARQFFDQPLARKLRLSIRHSAHNRGYVGLSDEKLDPDAGEDRKEAFNIGLELPVDPADIKANRPFRGSNVWPYNGSWRKVTLEYFNRCWALGRTLHRAFCLDLGIPESYFEDKLDVPLAVLRLLHYPARSGVADPALGAGEHTDYGNVTILATDAVGGLQVRDRTGVWMDAPTIPGTFLCNIGDCLMRWTNDVYVSTAHRVVVPERDRYSVAFFLDPNPDALVEPICAQGEHPKYSPITAEAYIRERLDATYSHRTDRALSATPTRSG
jgi:isopenicillin N synthase-like dioxygenase